MNKQGSSFKVCQHFKKYSVRKIRNRKINEVKQQPKENKEQPPQEDKFDEAHIFDNFNIENGEIVEIKNDNHQPQQNQPHLLENANNQSQQPKHLRDLLGQDKHIKDVKTCSSACMKKNDESSFM